MQQFHVRLHVTEDGRVTGEAPEGLPPGDYDAAVATKPASHPDLEAALESIRRLQQDIARMPVLDHRSPAEILADDDTGMPRAW